MPFTLADLEEAKKLFIDDANTDPSDALIKQIQQTERYQLRKRNMSQHTMTTWRDEDESETYEPPESKKRPADTKRKRTSTPGDEDGTGPVVKRSKSPPLQESERKELKVDDSFLDTFSMDMVDMGDGDRQVVNGMGIDGDKKPLQMSLEVGSECNKAEGTGDLNDQVGESNTAQEADLCPQTGGNMQQPGALEVQSQVRVEADVAKTDMTVEGQAQEATNAPPKVETLDGKTTRLEERCGLGVPSANAGTVAGEVEVHAQDAGPAGLDQQLDDGKDAEKDATVSKDTEMQDIPKSTTDNKTSNLDLPRTAVPPTGGKASNPKSCPWCDDWAYGIIGLADDPPSRMCLRCRLAFMSIVDCPGHRISPHGGLNPMVFDHKAADDSLIATAGKRVKKNDWCSVCPSPAFFRCATQPLTGQAKSPESAQSVPGCGLLLCEECNILLRSFKNLAQVAATHRKEDPQFGCRADVDYLLGDSDVYKEIQRMQ